MTSTSSPTAESGSPTLAALRRTKKFDVQDGAATVTQDSAGRPEQQQLHKSLTLSHLYSIGIGCVVGGGIFVITGQSAARYAGPALVYSFGLGALSCIFTGYSFAELAAALPAVGSSYLYSAVFLGDGMAWTVGVCLALENLFASAAVAVGFSGAFSQLLYDVFGASLPAAVSTPTIQVSESGDFSLGNSLSINIVAVMLLLGLAAVLSFGAQESATMTTVAVIIKVGVLLLLIAYGVYFQFAHSATFAANHDPFIPPEKNGRFGWIGIARGAASVYFSFIGFDSVTAMSAEAVNPTRDVPLALVIVLVSCTLLYGAVTFYLTGLVNYTKLDVPSPVTFALMHARAPYFFQVLVDLGACAGLLSVTAVGLLGQSRVCYAMSIDGHLPECFAEVHPKFKVPHISILICGVFACVLAGFLPLDVIGDLVSFGTLVAFIAVNAALILKRRDFPDMPSPFRVPTIAFPYLGIVTCLLTLAALPPATVRNFVALLLASFIFYYFFRLRHKAHAISLEWAENERQIVELERRRFAELRPGQFREDYAHVLGHALEEVEKETETKGDEQQAPSAVSEPPAQQKQEQ